MRISLLLLVACGLCCLVYPFALVRDADLWSKPANGIRARLSFAQKEIVNGTPILVTYLELQNVSDQAAVVEIPWDRAQLTWTVTDSAGNKVAPADGPFDEIRLDTTGLLRIPNDSLLKLNVAHRGAGIAKDIAAHLDLGPFSHWWFKKDDKRTFYLQGKLVLPKKDDKLWWGTLETPKIQIPIPASKD